MSSPRVSVVMPAHNAARFVMDSIGSVVAQKFADWELLLVDDGSSDGTADIVRARCAGEPRIRVITLERNQGPAVARNTAIEAARGRHIAFLDSDDLWHADKLAMQVPLLESSEASLIYSAYDVMKGDRSAIVRTVRVPERIIYKDLLRGHPVGCLTAIYDTAKVGKLYMPDIRMRQDWGLWLRVLRGGRWGLGVQRSLATLRLHPRSLSANKLRAMYFNYKILRTEGQLGPLGAAIGAGTHLLGAARRRICRGERC